MNWAFMTANFIGREINYSGKDVLKEWGKGHQATVEAFHGPHFAQKFEELVNEIKEMGFDALELWVAHLDPLKADSKMIDTAIRILHEYKVSVIAYTAGFGTPGITRDEATRIFEVAQAIGAPVLAQGFHPNNGPLVQELGQRYNIRMGLENHPEKNSQEVIEKVGPFSPWVGSCIDTGWFATQGYDAAQAVEELEDYLVHVHLKDIKAAGGHDTCILGDGIVDIKQVLATLKQINYTGPLTIEHEPLEYDPTDDVKESLKRLKKWWNEV